MAKISLILASRLTNSQDNVSNFHTAWIVAIVHFVLQILMLGVFFVKREEMRLLLRECIGQYWACAQCSRIVPKHPHILPGGDNKGLPEKAPPLTKAYHFYLLHIS